MHSRAGYPLRDWARIVCAFKVYLYLFFIDSVLLQKMMPCKS